jgi:hypothetical protein
LHICLKWQSHASPHLPETKRRGLFHILHSNNGPLSFHTQQNIIPSDADSPLSLKRLIFRCHGERIILWLVVIRSLDFFQVEDCAIVHIPYHLVQKHSARKGIVIINNRNIARKTHGVLAMMVMMSS